MPHHWGLLLAAAAWLVLLAIGLAFVAARRLRGGARA